jgi:hypothetical protein
MCLGCNTANAYCTQMHSSSSCGGSFGYLFKTEQTIDWIECNERQYVYTKVRIHGVHPHAGNVSSHIERVSPIGKLIYICYRWPKESQYFLS